MSRSAPTRLILGAALAVSATLLLPACSTPAKPADAAPPASADAAGNFGFPLGFSPSKMDTTADPRQDFRRYAGGRWLDAAKIPGDKLEISGYLVMKDTVQAQLRDLLQEAARTSGAASQRLAGAAGRRLLRVGHGRRAPQSPRRAAARIRVRAHREGAGPDGAGARSSPGCS